MPTKTHNEVHSPGYDYYAKVSGGHLNDLQWMKGFQRQHS